MTDNSWKVGDRAERLEDHPLVKAGEVHEVTEMFRGGYLGFRRPVGGEWNPSGWRKVTAADDRGDGNEGRQPVVTPKPDELAIAVESDLDAVFNHVGPEDEVWVHGMTPQEIGDLTALGWEDQVETLLQDANELDKERKPGTAARVRFAARFIGQALSVRRARLSARQEGK
jgi:phospholipase C